MTLKDIVTAIEAYADPALQESWDNTGWQIAPMESSDECSGVMLCLDVTPAVVEEAKDQGCNLIVSHHPLIFKGLRSITGASQAERAVILAIRHGIAVYSSHTALDSTRGGISYEMARMLGARVIRALAPAPTELLKLSVICSPQAVDDVQLVMLDNGASTCCIASIRSSSISNDNDGISIDLDSTPACRISATLSTNACRKVKEALASTPGSAAYIFETSVLRSDDTSTGLGVVAELESPLKGDEILALVKEHFGVPMR